MWTVENRARYDRSKLRYPSDLTDEEWSLAKAEVPRAKRGGNKRTVDVREVMNGLMYVLSTGCQWRAVPKDLPPRSTVNHCFCRWQRDGTLDRLHHALYVLCRELGVSRSESAWADCEANPTAAIIDSQSVKSAEKGGGGSIRRALMAARRSRQEAAHPCRHAGSAGGSHCACRRHPGPLGRQRSGFASRKPRWRRDADGDVVRDVSVPAQALR